jgi:hypothetical protein
VFCDLALSRLDQLIGTLNYRARQTRAKPSSISSSGLSSRVVATTTAFTFSWADPASLISCFAPLRPNLPSRCARQELVHELGHALLHGEDLPSSRDVTEAEVESVAYIHALGLDTSDYSFAYVARWSDGATELVKETVE